MHSPHPLPFLRTRRATSAVVVSLAFTAMLLAACTSGGGEAVRDLNAAPTPAQTAMLIELKALETPPGVDDDVFAAMKETFSKMVLAGDIAGAGKLISAGMGVDVTDLSAVDQGGGNVLLTWTYRHRGDYDQNGEVNVSDISPIGVHYLKNTGSADWNMARVADGDTNNEVNVSDLTPIGQNYGSIVNGYQIESSATPGDSGSWSAVTEIDLSQGTIPAGQPFRTFSTTLTGQPAGLSYRVTASVSSTGGTGNDQYDEQENNDDIASANQLPAGSVVGFQGSLGSGAGYLGYDGDADDLFRFTAANDDHLDITLTLDSSTGDLDLYLLNGSGETLLSSQDTGNTERIQATVTNGGTFNIAVSCYSGYSDYTLGVAITTGSGNQAPQAALTANPLSGPSPLVVNFDASTSVDPDGSITQYEWDWEDDGTWDENSGASPTTACTYTGTDWSVTARVRVTDNGGLTGTATVNLLVGSSGFVEPPVESFVDYSQASDSASRKWLLNCYRVLPPWQDADRVFQSSIFREWADEVLTLTNQQRALNGLPALVFDPHIELVSQAHARDMALRQYFAHENPYGMAFSDRLNAVDRPPYTAGDGIAGENIYAGRATPREDSPQQAVDWWMNSPGHRANILNPNVTHLGVGVYYHTGDPQNYYAYFVQVFANWSVDPGTHDWLEPAEVPAP